MHYLNYLEVRLFQCKTAPKEQSEQCFQKQAKSNPKVLLQYLKQKYLAS